MRGNPSKHKATASSIMTLAAVEDIIATCPKCGGEVGLWSENNETLCVFCDQPVFDREGTVH